MAVFKTSDGIDIAHDVVGTGPPILLLHGFPQTRALWSAIAPRLADRYTVVTADLRGYGASSKPEAAPDLSNYSFRAMGRDMAELMARLGHDRFHLVGHDRGARVAYRLARDAPLRITSLTLMDIVPTDHLLQTFGWQASNAYYHWSFLAQPAPLPERLIAAEPDLFYEACLGSWGGASVEDFAEISAYRAAWRDRATIAGMTNDYRAAVTIDLEHDAEDDGRLGMPALVLYGTDGVMARLYDVPVVWSERLENMSAMAIPGGHFFIDQSPEATVTAMTDFLGRLD